MAELKQAYSDGYLTKVAETTHRYYPAFPRAEFLDNTIHQPHWPELALKERMRLISTQLYQLLNLPFDNSMAVLIPVSDHFGGGENGDYVSMFFPDIVEQFGLDDFETSMRALEHFTCRSSSEFAIRPFLQQYTSQTLAQLEKWAEHDVAKIRRLASEGCRPRLPWAMSLPAFKADPTPIIAILEKLKNDPSLFVRRSVANNLNDVAKDNPKLVIDLCKRWFGNNENTDWIVKHGCRTLLKQSHAEALQLFGFEPPSHITLEHIDLDKSVAMGDILNFGFALSSQQALGKLRLEYAIGFVKANGKKQEKVFQISESTVADTQKQVQKSFSFKPISTRRYYPGEHDFSLRINGETLYHSSFALYAG